MIELQKEIYLNLEDNIYNKILQDNILFFDIETTGFDREKEKVVLISGGWFLNNKKFIIKQYFAETLNEEVNVLKAFKDDVIKFNSWCSYNGKAFDEPFIKNRMRINNIQFTPPKEHIDLYRIIRPYYKQLGMERCNLKSVEKYLGIHRADKIDGGISVELYYDFLDTKDERLKYVIMLHNYEDVLNLPSIFKLAYDIKTNSSLKREGGITKKQLDYLRFLFKKNNIKVKEDITKISKKSASRIIDNILRGNVDSDKFNEIIKDSY